MLETLGTKSG